MDSKFKSLKECKLGDFLICTTLYKQAVKSYTLNKKYRVFYVETYRDYWAENLIREIYFDKNNVNLLDQNHRLFIRDDRNKIKKISCHKVQMFECLDGGEDKNI